MKISIIILLASVLLDPVIGAVNVRGGRASRKRSHRKLSKGKGGKGKSKSSSSSGSTTDDGGLCFSERATVTLKGAENPVAMKDLQVGDQVLATSGSYEPIYAFGHWHPTKEVEFLQIYTEENPNVPLEITGSHLIFLKDYKNPIRAASLLEGDVLDSASANNGAMVQKIHKVTRKGIYAPLTPTGKLVVNNIQTSSYITMQKKADEYVECGGYKVTSYQDYVHMGLAPFRLLCQGIASNLCERYNAEGMPYYPAFAVWLNQWASQQNMIVHALVLMMVFVITGTCMAFERAFGAKFGPSIVASVAVIAVWMKRKGIQIRKAKKD